MMLNQDFNFSANQITLLKEKEGFKELLERWFALHLKSWICKPNLGFNFKSYLEKSDYINLALDLENYLKKELQEYAVPFKITRLSYNGKDLGINYTLEGKEGYYAV